MTTTNTCSDKTYPLPQLLLLYFGAVGASPAPSISHTPWCFSHRVLPALQYRDGPKGSGTPGCSVRGPGRPVPASRRSSPEAAGIGKY